MKRLVLFLVIVMTLTLSGAPDVLQQLGVPKADAGTEVLNSLSSGSPNYHRVRSAFKNAAPAARAALVEQVLTWTKAYVNSPQFAKDYAQYRAEAKPEKPEESESVDQELARQKAEQDAQIAEMKKSLKDMPASMRPEMEKAIKEAEKSFAEMRRNPELQAAMRDNLEAERAGALEEYNQRVETWNEEYPADPRVLAKQRLQQFLAATDDIDFNAKLVSKNGKMRFANEDYESKDSDWKLAYRAGKPAVDAARAFAKQWLAELK